MVSLLGDGHTGYFPPVWTIAPPATGIVQFYFCDNLVVSKGLHTFLTLSSDLMTHKNLLPSAQSSLIVFVVV